jgi:hypothetical protein
MLNKPRIGELASIAGTTRFRRRTAADHRFMVAQQRAFLRALLETNRIAISQQKRSRKPSLNVGKPSSVTGPISKWSW